MKICRRAPAELQRIIQPIAFAQHHGFMLRRGRLELWVKHHTGQGDGRRNAARNHIAVLKLNASHSQVKTITPNATSEAAEPMANSSPESAVPAP